MTDRGLEDSQYYMTVIIFTCVQKPRNTLSRLRAIVLVAVLLGMISRRVCSNFAWICSPRGSHDITDSVR